MIKVLFKVFGIVIVLRVRFFKFIRFIKLLGMGFVRLLRLRFRCVRLELLIFRYEGMD